MNFGNHMGLAIRDKVKPLTNPLKMIQNEHDKTRSSELNNGNYKKLECFWFSGMLICFYSIYVWLINIGYRKSFD